MGNKNATFVRKWKICLSTNVLFKKPIHPQRKTRKKQACSDYEDNELVNGSQEDVILEHKINPLFIYADIEAMRDENPQQPILLMASTDEDEEIIDFSGVDCVEIFVLGST